MAAAGAPSALAAARALSPGRAVLRRPGGRARPVAETRAPQRRQPAPDQLLPLAAARSRRGSPMHNDRALYAATARAQRLLRAERRTRRRVAVLLPESHRLQRSRRQQERRVQRARRITIAYVRDFTPFRDLRALGFHNGFRGAAAHAPRFRLRDPPYDVPFTAYRRADFPGTTRRVAQWLTIHRGPVVSSTSAPTGSSILSIAGARRPTQMRRGDRCTGTDAAREVPVVRNLIATR